MQVVRQFEPAREAHVADAFQAGDADVMLVSLKAGGTGLNLTAASAVIMLDPWWNPAVEQQAHDRVYRIGQSQPVTIFQLVSVATVEDGVLALQATKHAPAEAMLEGAPGTSTSSIEDLLLLLSPDDGATHFRGVALPPSAGAHSGARPRLVGRSHPALPSPPRPTESAA